MAKRIYVDMDGVVFDFMTPYKKAVFEGTRRYPQSKIGFFRDLEPIEGAIPTILALDMMGYDVWFLTRPSVKNLHCYTEKAESIQKHFGEAWVRKLIISTDKSLLKGDYLIDDTTNANQLMFEGHFIRFHQEKCNWYDIAEMFGMFGGGY